MAPVSASSKFTISPRPNPSVGDGDRAREFQAGRSATRSWPRRFFHNLVSWLKSWLWSFAGWSVVPLVLGAKLTADTGGPWTMTIRPGIRDWLPWAVLTPILFRFVRRFPIDRQSWKTRVPLHLVCCAIVVALCQWWQAFFDPLFRPAPLPPPPPDAARHFGPNLPPPPPHAPPPFGPSPAWVDLFHVVTFGLPIYLMILSGAHAVVFFRRDQQRAASLAQARLEVLKSQLQPHFLFNTLNVIAELVHQDAEKADAMITALSDMLRLTLDSASDQFVRLKREIEFVERYVAIMQVRLDQRLAYKCEITPALLEALVPPFLLQPLVENAILHGIEPVAEGGMVTVRAWREGSQLHLSVADDGVGLEAPPDQEGIGLANTRARLQELFGNEAEISLTNGTGVTVRVTLPFRT